MKKLLSLLTATLLLFVTGCSGGGHSTQVDKPTGDFVEIKEKMFIAQTNDVYANINDYLGKTIKYEGLVKKVNYENKDYYYVIRYGPGCCGTDGDAGFEVTWDGEYPQDKAWVEAVGVLETYEHNGFKYLRLRLTSLKELETRGKETVTQ